MNLSLKKLMENYEQFLNDSYQINKGDVVEDVNPDSPSYKSIGRVVELKTELASAVVRLPNGKLLERSIEHLVKRLND